MSTRFRRNRRKRRARWAQRWLLGQLAGDLPANMQVSACRVECRRPRAQRLSQLLNNRAYLLGRLCSLALLLSHFQRG